MLMTCMQHGGYAMRLFPDLGWFYHTLLCAYASFTTPSVCVVAECFVFSQGHRDERKTERQDMPLLLGNHNAAKAKMTQHSSTSLCRIDFCHSNGAFKAPSL